MPQPNITTLAAVKQLVRTELDDTLVEPAWRAAEAYVDKRTAWFDTAQPTSAPDDLVQAVALLTARYLTRRNSPDGLVGSGELGPVRVPGVDRDVDRLIAPWRQVVLA